MAENPIIAEIIVTNRLLRRMITLELKHHAEWQANIKKTDAIAANAEKFMTRRLDDDKDVRDVLDNIKPAELAEMMKNASEGMKYISKELKDKEKDDAD